MIEKFYYYITPTVIGSIVEGIPALLESSKALVNQVALSIIGQILISIPLYYLQQNLFTFGVAIGFIFNEQVAAIVAKVNVVYSVHRSLLEEVLLFVGGSTLVVLSMPASMVIATLYYSSQWGALLYQNSLGRSSKNVDEAGENKVAPNLDAPDHPLVIGDALEPERLANDNNS